MQARLSLKDQVHFAKRLSFLMSAGVPLAEGLDIMRGQARGGSRARVLESIVRDVSGGQSLSRSFSKFPRVFGGFTVSVVRVGESSGTLSASLAYLAEELAKKHLLRRKLAGACIYPLIITLATFGITAFLMLYLFPKIMPVFASLHTTLPFTTRVVMATSVFLERWGIVLLLAGVAAAVAGGIVLAYSRVARWWRDWALLRLPVAGRMIMYYNVAQGTRTLGLLLTSGLRLSEALSVAVETARNSIYKEEFIRLGKVVERGERMSVYMRKRPAYFPNMLADMLAVGERSGSLSETLLYLSDMYEREVDDAAKNISILMEPALMVIMGLVVGFIAVSIVTPIYGVTQDLHA